jgi:rhodanese-related sulfurtransferase
MKIKPVKLLVDEALAIVKTITASEVKSMLENPDKNILIDIRDIRELHNSGTIEGSRHMPRGMLEFWLDPQSPYYKKDIPVEVNKILFCASNWRSALATKTLMEMGFDNVMHVEGGYQSLIDSGFKKKEVQAK